ncbi:hypothetical protein [Methylobacterium oxalidis]|uniref:hypothetical protein n=1 Tax=Methylobacterium oxalidis TaxID=944322 RepID=UPI003314A137
MTPAERQALEDARAACLVSAEAIAAKLAGAEVSALPARDAFVPLKTAAAAFGIQDDSGRRKAARLMKSQPGLVTKRGGTRWYVHREALR